MEKFDSEESEYEQDIEDNSKKMADVDWIIEHLMQLNTIYRNVNCPTCFAPISKNKTKLKDPFIWRCSKRGINAHYIKISIRKNTIFENSNMPISNLYFHIFTCFIERYTVERSLNELLQNNLKSSKQSINLLYKRIRAKITSKMMEIWRKNPIGTEPADGWVPRVECDETHLMKINNETIWLFGMYDRGIKQVRLYVVGNDR